MWVEHSNSKQGVEYHRMKLKIQQRPDHAEPSRILGNKLQKGFKEESDLIF